MKQGHLGLLVVIALEFCYIVIHHYIVSSVIFLFSDVACIVALLSSWDL